MVEKMVAWRWMKRVVKCIRKLKNFDLVTFGLVIRSLDSRVLTD